MKVLLLHPKDNDPPPGRWDLVVDLECAPAATYERWSRRLGCPVISLYSFGEEIEDLYRLRALFQHGRGFVVDACGIDWWDVPALLSHRALFDVIQAGRLASQIGRHCDLYCSRPDPRVSALQSFLGVQATILRNRPQQLFDRARHYSDVVSRFDATRLFHIVQDKFDARHRLRSWLAPPPRSSSVPMVLLPTPYINVSRTAVSFAKLLPEQPFLLMVSRPNGKLDSLPHNVRMSSLDSYFVPEDHAEMADLRREWEKLKTHLVSSSEEFRAADAAGILARVAQLLPWGIAVRDAWKKVFDSERITACFCADDFNPYSRIPLLLAGNQGIPTAACHHGALAFPLAFKPHEADFYLAKGEMEYDYLARICRIQPEKIVLGGAGSADVPAVPNLPPLSQRPWLVFFTEPFEVQGSRYDEVYRDLLPRLCRLAESCQLKLVFKLHPFESPKGYWKMLARLLPSHQVRQVQVISGPPAPELWQNTRAAITVQSTVALECTMLGIPTFLCAWLQTPYGGYVSQFSRFRVGQRLEAPDDLASVPQRLAAYEIPAGVQQKLVTPLPPDVLRSLLAGERLTLERLAGERFASAQLAAANSVNPGSAPLPSLSNPRPHSN